MKKLATLFTALLLLSGVASATDWPMYGFDISQSRFNSLETAITPANVQTLIQAWQFRTPQPISATPAVVNGVVYIGSWDGYEYGLDELTGELKWKTYLVQTHER